MVNPNLLTVNPIIYFLLLIPIIGIYSYAKWGKEKISTGIGMCILDILPAFQLVLFNTRSSLMEWFIIVILFAMISIRVHIVVGALSYLAIYLAIGIIFMINDFSIFTLLVGMVIIAALATYVITLKNLDKWTKIGGILYGFFALVPLLYCFNYTFNPGFLSLVVGDILLGATQIVSKERQKMVNYISNIFFYIGVWLVPLSLI